MQKLQSPILDALPVINQSNNVNRAGFRRHRSILLNLSADGRYSINPRVHPATSFIVKDATEKDQVVYKLTQRLSSLISNIFLKNDESFFKLHVRG